MCGFDGIQRGNYFGGEPIARAEVEVRVGKLKNRKAAGKDKITGEMIKGGDDRVVDWISTNSNGKRLVQLLQRGSWDKYR